MSCIYTMKDLTLEIAVKIDNLREASEPVLHPDWITQDILNAHPKRSKDGFYLCCSRHTVREEVRRYLNKFKLPTAPSDKQVVLPGFDHLQEYYLCNRDGTQVSVHIDNLTDEELELKAAELDAMAEGCKQHVWEIRRFIAFRRAKAKRSA